MEVMLSSLFLSAFAVYNAWISASNACSTDPVFMVWSAIKAGLYASLCMIVVLKLLWKLHWQNSLNMLVEATSLITWIVIVCAFFLNIYFFVTLNAACNALTTGIVWEITMGAIFGVPYLIILMGTLFRREPLVAQVMGPAEERHRVVISRSYVEVTYGSIVPTTLSSQCPICQEEFKQDEPVLPLPCRHPTHKECLHGWVVRKGTDSTCPTCRNPISVSPEVAV